MDRLLPIDAALGRQMMPAMGVDEVVLGDVPQPQMKRHRRRLQVIAQPAARFDQHVLHDIAGVEPLRNRRVEAQIDHAANRLAVPGEQLLDGVGISRFRLAQQHLRIVCVGPHRAII